jgi:hypothetical protein
VSFYQQQQQPLRLVAGAAVRSACEFLIKGAGGGSRGARRLVWQLAFCYDHDRHQAEMHVKIIFMLSD